jgi:hypothetical protein
MRCQSPFRRLFSPQKIGVASWFFKRAGLPRRAAAGSVAPMSDTPSKPAAESDGPQESKPAKPDPPKEIGGPKGPEPTRYGDWERNGRVSDF